MTSTTSRNDGGKDEKKLSAVVVAEQFDKRLSLLSPNKSFGLHEICGKRAIEHTLGWLSRTEATDIVLVVSERNLSEYKLIEKKWRCVFDSLTVVVCLNAQSVGDALREVDARGHLSSHFLLIPHPSSFVSSDLKQAIKEFRVRYKENRSNVMTLIYAQSQENKSAVAFDDSGKLLAFHSPVNPTSLDSDKEESLRESGLLKSGLADSAISICTLQVLALFTDNFDFQQRDDVIREILVNEDLMLKYIHVHVLPPQQIAFCVVDFAGVCLATSLLISRWIPPFPALDSNIHLVYDRKNLIRDQSSQKLTMNGWNVSAGRNVRVAADSFVVNAFIGNDSNIGEGSSVMDAVIGSHSSIGSHCQLKEVVVGDNATIQDGCILPPRTIVTNNVKVSKSLVIPSGSLLSTQRPDEELEDAVHCKELAADVFCWRLRGAEWWSGSSVATLSHRQIYTSETVIAKEEEEQEEYDPSRQFFLEITESMQGSIGDEKPSKEDVKNLILEINSSKLAYNISMEDVARLIFLAFLRLPGADQSISSFREKFLNWIALFENYYGPKKSQAGLLCGLQEHVATNPSRLEPMVPKMLHLLYEKDVLGDEAILEWHSDLPSDSSLSPLLAKLVEWLEESDEDEEEEDEE